VHLSKQCGFMRACHLFCNKASACREYLGGPGILPFQKLQRSCTVNNELRQGRLIKVRPQTSDNNLTKQLTQRSSDRTVLTTQFGQSNPMSTLFGEVH